MSTLPDWKIRRRFKIEGNQRHGSQGGTHSENNRHWDPLLNQNAGGWRDENDSDGMRAMEDEVWSELNNWIYGAVTAFGVLLKNGKTSKETMMDLYRIVKCCPSFPDFVRRRLEYTHRTHQRTSICLESMVMSILSRWKRANASAARDLSHLEPRHRQRWEKQFLGSTVCSVLVLIPEDLRGTGVNPVCIPFSSAF